MPTYLKASDTAIIDLHELAIQNDNPKISHYRQGYEKFFNNTPLINSPAQQLDDLDRVNYVMGGLSWQLAQERWVGHNTPIKNQFLRTVLAMEKPACNSMTLRSGYELQVINWKDGAITPIHGHPYGYMNVRLVFGKVKQATYRLVDATKRLVRPIALELLCNTNDILSDGYSDYKGVTDGAFIHELTFLEPSATLHLVPEHPSDAANNIFIKEEFGFKHVNFQLEDFVAISLNATLKLMPGDVILVRSNTTKDLGDHFYVITDAPRQKKAGLRPVGTAIQASEDFSKLLDTVEPQGDNIRIMRLMPRVRDWFLEWHGIRVQKTLVFPKP